MIIGMWSILASSSYHFVMVLQMLLQHSMKSGMGMGCSSALPVMATPRLTRAYAHRSFE